AVQQLRATPSAVDDSRRHAAGGAGCAGPRDRSCIDTTGGGFRLSNRFHNYSDVFRDGDRCPGSEIRRHVRPRRHKDTEKKHVARLTARPAVQADRVERLLCVSVSQWLVQIDTSAYLRNAVLRNREPSKGV